MIPSCVSPSTAKFSPKLKKKQSKLEDEFHFRKSNMKLCEKRFPMIIYDDQA